MDRLSPSQRHTAMQHIKSSNTSIEMMLRKALWHKGYRYRKNYTKLIGKPDIVITKYHIAIFCDGEFFHGKDWPELQKKILSGNNSQYWYGKITRNIERDQNVTSELRSHGWTVLRFWGKDIKDNLSGCLQAVDEAVFDTITS